MRNFSVICYTLNKRVLIFQMKSKSSVSSLISLISTVILVAGLAVWLVLGGGMAFNPGPITAHAAEGKPEIQGFKNHAAFESQCNLCHLPFSNDQATLCLKCHQNISSEITDGVGVHAKIIDVRACYACHPDHKGREFSPALSGAKKFDHSNTHFVLIHHQIDFNATPLTCEKCHLGIKRSVFAFDPSACIDCHKEKNLDFITSHVENYGNQCLECHEGSDQFAEFKHSTENFALTGRHATLECIACHLDSNRQPHFKDLTNNCNGCHSEPSIHAGNFKDQSCDTCHSTDGWKPAKIDGANFEHFANTGFTLAKHTESFDKSPITCRNCHGDDIHNKSEGKCLECHQLMSPSHMEKHIVQFGEKCASCHDGVDRYKNFDHKSFFILDGAHIGLECTKCHGNDISTAVYRGLGNTCITCHAEPEIHTGFFGLACEDCHSTSAWRPAFLKLHNFPLDHGGSEQTCTTCHPNNYATYTCYTCHDHEQSKIEATHIQANINRDELPNCTNCHKTGLHNDWTTP